MELQLPRLDNKAYYQILRQLPFLQRFKEINTKTRNIYHRDDLVKELINDPQYVPTKFIVEHYTECDYTSSGWTYREDGRMLKEFSNWNDFRDLILILKKEDENDFNIIKWSIENDYFALRHTNGSISDYYEIVNKIATTHSIGIRIGTYTRYPFIDVTGKENTYIQEIIFNKKCKPELFMDMFVCVYWFVKYLNLNTPGYIRKNELSSEARDYFIDAVESLILSNKK